MYYKGSRGVDHRNGFMICVDIPWRKGRLTAAQVHLSVFYWKYHPHWQAIENLIDIRYPIFRNCIDWFCIGEQHTIWHTLQIESSRCTAFAESPKLALSVFHHLKSLSSWGCRSFWALIYALTVVRGFLQILSIKWTWGMNLLSVFTTYKAPTVSSISPF